MSCIFGVTGDTFFPKENENCRLTSMQTGAERCLAMKGLTPKVCEAEEEERMYSNSNKTVGTWPCFFPTSDTTGEKPIEEFYTEDETLDLESYLAFGIIKNDRSFDAQKLNQFEETIKDFRESKQWSKEVIVDLFQMMLPHFQHEEKGKSLDNNM